jgi:N-acetylglucosaminyl-diphospho-decaprenol L-rhamnosyltransferase
MAPARENQSVSSPLPTHTNEGQEATGQPDATGLVGVVVVSRDSAPHLNVLLPHLLDAFTQVVVVDNNSNDNSAEIATAASARVLRMPTNAGYSAACNAGARLLGSSVTWLAFVNPDVVLSAENLRSLTTDVPENIWAVAPLTVSPDGRPVADVARPAPTPWFVAAMYMGLTRSEAPLAGLEENRDDRYYFADVLSGSCLLIRQDRFSAVGGWDEAFFFNCEDIDICVRLAAAGGRNAIDKTVQVTHEKGLSSSDAGDEARRLECARAYATYFQLHGSRWETTLVAATAYSGCLARHVVESVQRLTRGKAGSNQRFGRLPKVLWATVRQSYRNRPPIRPARAEFLDA